MKRYREGPPRSSTTNSDSRERLDLKKLELDWSRLRAEDLIGGYRTRQPVQ